MADFYDRADGIAHVLDLCTFRRQREWEWIQAEVREDTWWEVVDNPEALRRGLDGWIFSSCRPSPNGDGLAVLTYYRELVRGRPGHVGGGGRTSAARVRGCRKT